MWALVLYRGILPLCSCRFTTYQDAAPQVRLVASTVLNIWNKYFTSITRYSVCTKSINLRVNILCLKFQLIIHHWKDLIEWIHMTPSLRQMAAPGESYSPSKYQKSAIQKMGLVIVFLKFLAKFFYCILLITFFYTRFALCRNFLFRCLNQK